MPRESKAKKQARALKIEERMDIAYPDPEVALNYKDPFTLTIAVLLAAQTTDANVNKVTPALFATYPTPAAMAQAKIEDVMEIIHSLGFFRMKAKHCVEAAQVIMTEFGGQCPTNVADLQKLPGVGRKTANCVSAIFGEVEGIAVDTHVFRIAHRLKLSNAETPEKTEEDLLSLYPQEYWQRINHQWVLFGREVCSAKNPHCESCFLGADLCPSFMKV